MTIYRLPGGQATITIDHVAPGLLCIDHLYVPPASRGHGAARRILAEVCRQADIGGLVLVLMAAGQEPDIDQLRLVRLYAEVGFVVGGVVAFCGLVAPLMVRLPR